MATYVIGDVQGCYEPLSRLLEQIAFDDSKDRLWLVGDLVNRGPHSLEVLRLLRSITDSCVITLGNHDLHALARWYRVAQPKSSDTLEPLLAAPDAGELFEWLRRRPLFYHDAALNYSMVHAGVIPTWDIDTSGTRAREVEAALGGSEPAHFLAEMYGDSPARWRDDLTSTGRLRVITNVLTRLRFCAADGTLELKRKGNLEEALSGYLPWFSHEQRKTRSDRIFFGHWATLRGVTHVANAIATDTGCAWGECLTAIRVEDQQRFQTPCAKAQ